MVVLSLTPHRGNGARTFPATGFLGLTPVTFAGTVKTKLEEDNRPLQASSVVVRVRCYEAVGGHATTSQQQQQQQSDPVASTSALGPSPSPSSSTSSSSLASAAPAPASSLSISPDATTTDLASASIPHINGKGRVLYEKAVRCWSAKDHSTVAGAPYADLGDFTKMWRISIPPEAVNHGAKSTMIFKSWRVWWAIEAVIYHVPSGIHGDRITRTHQVALINHSPSPGIQVPSSLRWTSDVSELGPPPAFEYDITCDSSSYGSSDPFSFAVNLHRSSSTDSPKRITFELRREITYTLSDSPASPNFSLPSSSKPLRVFHRQSSPKPSLRRSSTEMSLVHDGPASITHSPSSRTTTLAPPAIDSEIAPVEAASLPVPGKRTKREDVSLLVLEHEVAFDSAGQWTGRVQGSMPKAKSLYHYALGETCNTPSGSCRFYWSIKVSFRQRSVLVELGQRDVHLSSVSQEDRAKAQSQIVRITAIQKAESKLFSESSLDKRPLVRASSDTPGKSPHKSSGYGPSSRRRSEQTDSTENPRTRIRLQSDPQSGGKVPSTSSSTSSSSPTVTLRDSPKPSIGVRRQASPSMNSGRSLRPRSAGGPSPQATSPALHITSPSPAPSSTSTFRAPTGLAIQFEGGPSDVQTMSPALVPSALFAGFSAYSVKAGHSSSEVFVGEENIPPKPGVHRPRSKGRSSSSRPKSAKEGHRPGPFGYEPPCFPNTSLPNVASDLPRSSESSASTPFVSPPSSAVASNSSCSALTSPTSSMSRTSSTRSKGSPVLEPLTTGKLNVRRSSGRLANFFRRGSKS